MPVIVFPKPLEGVGTGVTPVPIMPQALVELDLGNLISGAILDDPLTATLEGTVAPFSPADITGLVAWYDFSTAASNLWTDTGRTSAVTADGNELRGVTDKSGNGHHLSAAGAATTYPLYKTAIQNGLSVARFNGNDLVGTVDQITLSNDYTIFIACSRTSNATYQNLWDGDSGGGPRNFQTRYIGGANQVSVIPRPGSGTETIAAVSAAGTVDVITFRVVSNIASGARTYANGSPGTATTSPVTLTTVRMYQLGGTGSTATPGTPGSTQLLTGDVCEVIHYDTALSVADHNLVGNYLQAKWATPTWTTVT